MIQDLPSGSDRFHHGASTTAELGLTQPLPSRVQVDVVRPTGFSARSATWTA
jgi:hypothetical protein